MTKLMTHHLCACEFAGQSAEENPLSWRQRMNIALQVAEGILLDINVTHLLSKDCESCY